MDYLVATKNTKITALRDQWLIYQGKANVETKTRVKKLADIKKKEKNNVDKEKKIAIVIRYQTTGYNKLPASNRYWLFSRSVFRSIY